MENIEIIKISSHKKICKKCKKKKVCCQDRYYIVDNGRKISFDIGSPGK